MKRKLADMGLSLGMDLDAAQTLSAGAAAATMPDDDDDDDDTDGMPSDEQAAAGNM